MAGLMGRNQPQEPVQPASPPPPPDPVVEAARLARAVQAEESAVRNAQLRRSAEGRDEQGRRLPEKAKARRPIGAFRKQRGDVDQSIILDSEGNRAGSPGMIHRWVRLREDIAKGISTSSARMADYLNFGYQPNHDPVTGKPIISHLGMAMECAPEDYADRMLRYMPDGALDRDELMAATEHQVERMNAAAGGKVARMVVEEQHGSFRQREEIVPQGGFASSDDDPD